MANFSPTLKEDDRLRVTKRDAYMAGSCQGCGEKNGDVFEINAHNWITRFCWDCLQRILRDAKRQR